VFIPYPSGLAASFSQEPSDIARLFSLTQAGRDNSQQFCSKRGKLAKRGNRKMTELFASFSSSFLNAILVEAVAEH